MKTIKEKEQLRKEFKERLKAIPQEKKSKFVLWLESYEPVIEIVDMKAILK
jgi:hypothetical protein